MPIGNTNNGINPPKIVVSTFSDQNSSESLSHNQEGLEGETEEEEEEDFDDYQQKHSTSHLIQSPPPKRRRKSFEKPLNDDPDIIFNPRSQQTDSIIPSKNDSTSRRSSISIADSRHVSLDYSQNLSFLTDDDAIPNDDGSRLSPYHSGSSGGYHETIEDKLLNRWDRYMVKRKQGKLNSSNKQQTKPKLQLDIPINSTSPPKLSPNILQLPSLNNDSKVSVNKVLDDDLNDLDFALNDTLKSALVSSKPKWETNSKLKDRLNRQNDSNLSFQTGNDLELGLSKPSIKEFDNDIELTTFQPNELTFQLPMNSSQISDNQSISSKKTSSSLNFFSLLDRVAKNINADDEDDDDFDEDDNNNNTDDDEEREGAEEEDDDKENHNLVNHRNPNDNRNSLFSNDFNDLSSLISVTGNHLDNQSTSSHVNPFNDSNEIITQQKTNTPVEEIKPLFGKSLGIFSPKSYIRKLSYRILTNFAFQTFISILLVIQLSLISVMQSNSTGGYSETKEYSKYDWALFSFYLVYTFDSILKIISFGLFDDSQLFREMKIERYQNLLERYYHGVSHSFKMGEVLNPKSFINAIKSHSKYFKSSSKNIDSDTNSLKEDENGLREELLKDYKWSSNKNKKGHPRRAFLNNDWNRVDFVSILAFWISFIMSMNSGVDAGKYQIFRSLMCLKMLRILNYSSSSRLFLKGIKNAIFQSRKVIGFLLCFWILLSIIGVESFKSSLRRQCVWTNPNNSTDTFLNEFQFCGSYLEPITLKRLPYLNEDGSSSGSIKGFACPVNSVCITRENPYNGAISYDDIFKSMELVFVIMSANTFTDIMYYTMDSDTMAASLFYIISIFVLVIWLLNLIIATIIQSYRELAEKEKKKQKPSIWKKTNALHTEFYKNSTHYVKFFDKSNSLFVFAILFNISFDATKSYKTTDFENYNNCDFTISVILLAEIVFRFFSYVLDHNPKLFFYSIYNRIDLFLAIITFILTLPPLYRKMDTVAYGWLSVFIIFRFYRVIVWSSSLRKSWEIVFNRARTLLRMTWFAALFIYIVSLIMSRLFDGILLASEDQPWTMDNLPNSIISLYIITSTENWSSILYATQEATESSFTRFCIAIYLLSWFFISNTVLLSIFIGVITEGLELSINEKARNQLEKFIADCANKMNQPEEQGLFELVKAKLESDTGNSNVDSAELLDHVNSLLIKLGHQPIDPSDYKPKSFFQKVKSIEAINWSLNIITIISKYTRSKIMAIFTNVLWFKRKSDDSPDRRSFAPPNLLSDRIKNLKAEDRSLYIFSNNNNIRHTFQKWTNPPIGTRTEGAQPNHLATMLFNGSMFIFSIVVVVFACYVTPLYKYNSKQKFSYDYFVDIVFMGIFTIEFFIKVIADGLIFSPHAYIKSFWNILDFIVLISFWITAMETLTDSNNLLITFGALRALRAFRLLTITKVSLWNFEAAIIGGAKQILIASFISISLLVPFSLWGLNIFNGRLTSCSDGSSLNNCHLESLVEVGKWQVLSPRFDDTPNLNFDSFNSSFRSLFEIVSLEGWTGLLENVMNIVGPDEESRLFSSPANAIFVVLFNFSSIILILNLFVSIVIDSYAKKTGTAFLLDVQHSWYDVKKVLKKIKPSKRRNLDNMPPFKRKLNHIMLNKRGFVNITVNTLFFIHFMVLITEHYPYPDYGDTIRHAIFLFTTGGFLIHMNLLLYAIGLRMFVANRWNILRFIIVFTSFIMNIIAFKAKSASVFINIDKTMSVAVLLFVIPRVDTLNQLLLFGSASVTPLFWMIYTWLVLYIVFAIAMNQIFGLTRLGPNSNGNLNARTVTKALIMLFRSSFGEGWNDTMLDFEVELPYCINSVTGYSDCGNSTLAQLLFMLWNILSMYVFLNILISVVVNNFSYVYHSNGEHKLLTRNELRKFKSAWNKYDNYGTGWINLDQLSEFLSSLDGILSFHIYPKTMRIDELTKKWIKPSTTSDPYNITLNYNVINDHFAICNFKSIRKRRKRYDKMCIEIEQSATKYEDTDGELIHKVSFRNVILAVGFYSRFKNSDCLVISDRIKYNYNLRRVQRILQITKNIATIKMVYTTLQWNFLRTKKNIIEKLKNATPFEASIIKTSVIEKLKGTEIDHDELMENIRKDLENDEPVLHVGNDLSRVTSNASSINPFADVYKKNVYRDDL